MWSKIKSIFSPSSTAVNNVDDKLYNIRVLHTLDDPEISKVVHNLRSGIADGYIIKEAISDESREALVDFYKLMEEEGHTDKDGVASYPASFVAKIYQGSVEEDYFKENVQKAENLRLKSGFDLRDYFISAMIKMNGGDEVYVKPYMKGEGTFAPFSMRSLKKGGDNILAHCENAHTAWFPDLNNSLGEEKMQPNAIPFFLTLQKGEGGHTVLFDAVWKEGQYLKQMNRDYFKIINADGTKLDCSPKGIKRMNLVTELGDMLIFNGGKIWHMVERVVGEKKRITAGAFLNFTVDNKTEILG